MRGRQLTAARGLLDWTIDELAKKANVARVTIMNVEKGDSNPNTATQRKIINAINKAGVEFTNDGGVRPKQSVIKNYRGQKEFWEFFDDIYEVASEHENPDLCVTNVIEDEYDIWLGDYEPVHGRRMTKLSGYNVRVLLKEGDENMTSSTYAIYKWAPNAQFSDVSLYLYGDKVAFIEFLENDVVVTVVESATVTQSLRKMFEAVWSMALTSETGE
ncbi:MAG: hypothetical protein COB76_03495 [Alphaproteobacteria bacterium]|nr:MAG: hypothetical protein COB76_03495 [Alphaproteobacteria bacterium]